LRHATACMQLPLIRNILKALFQVMFSTECIMAKCILILNFYVI